MSDVQRLTTDRHRRPFPLVTHTLTETPAVIPVDVSDPTPPSVSPDVDVAAEASPAPARVPRRRAVSEDQLPSWLLRAGLAFVLSYAATTSFFHPETFARYFPSFMPSTWATELLPVFAVFEMALAAALMTERFTYWASMLAGLTMVAIIAANPDVFDVLFRNVAIACGAFALALQSRRERGDRAVGLVDSVGGDTPPDKEGMQ